MAERFDDNSPFMEAHRETWHDVLKIMKWSVIGIIAVLVLMAAFLL